MFVKPPSITFCLFSLNYKKNVQQNIDLTAYKLQSWKHIVKREKI